MAVSPPLWMSEHITILKRPYGWIYSHVTTEKAKHAFLRKEGEFLSRVGF